MDILLLIELSMYGGKKYILNEYLKNIEISIYIDENCLMAFFTPNYKGTWNIHTQYDAKLRINFLY